MTTLTLGIAITFSILVLVLPRPGALGSYLTLAVTYPTFLVVSMGTLDISASRIVVAVLFIRCVLGGNTSHLMSTWPSRMVTLLSLVSFLIPLLSWDQTALNLIENRLGLLLDTYISFAVTVCCIREHASFVTLAKWMSVVVIYLAVIGIFESTTGQLLFQPLKVYCPWFNSQESVTQVRYGFFRAEGPLSHPILFGMCFSMLLPLVFWLRHSSGLWRVIALVGGVACVIGTISSMSSGPWMMLIIVVVGLVLEHRKGLVRPLVALGVFACFGIAVLSNRPFYHVIASYLDPVGGSGWHRAKLIDNAIEHFSEWWLYGYGGRDPGWGESLGMTWTDITNHYLVYGIQYGLLGILFLIVTLVISVLAMRRWFTCRENSKIGALCWALATVLVALAIAFNSCTLFAQTHTLFFVLLGLVSSCADLLPEK